jgi:hypothetical protein
MGERRKKLRQIEDFDIEQDFMTLLDQRWGMERAHIQESFRLFPEECIWLRGCFNTQKMIRISK